MYADVDFKTKKAFKHAVHDLGQKITLYAPGLGEPNKYGWNPVEGPHYPAAHTWYAEARCMDGIVVEVK